MWSRIHCIKNNLERILEQHQNHHPTNSVNIISLGAGLDTMYFSIKEQYNGKLKYIEVDFEDLCFKKVSLN